MSKALLSMGFPSQKYGNGLPFPHPGDPPNPGIKPVSPAFCTTESPGKLPLDFASKLLSNIWTSLPIYCPGPSLWLMATGFIHVFQLKTFFYKLLTVIYFKHKSIHNCVKLYSIFLLYLGKNSALSCKL